MVKIPHTTPFANPQGHTAPARIPTTYKPFPRGKEKFDAAAAQTPPKFKNEDPLAKWRAPIRRRRGK